jgi:Kdo2-lipid IVA lauroyltransferase/acyltransferase
MSSAFAVFLFDLFARLPLPILHRMGGIFGWATYLLSGKYAERLRENLGHVWNGRPETEFRSVLGATVAEAGKSVLELPWVWRKPVSEVLASVQSCQGWQHVIAAQTRGKGIVILTPHTGCFEIIGLYVGAQMAMTCMYRVPKLAWLDGVMRQGRERGQMKLARADIGGVRTLYKALKRGEVIGILPDQVPGNGEGEWMPFFGRPAYTMTLVSRLLESSHAAVLMCAAQRLPDGTGYALTFEPLEFHTNSSVTLQINQAVEALVRTCPEQYLWSYNRYKIPAGVVPPKVNECA